MSNTLVLVQFINNMRETGLPLKEALVEAGVIRIRPILLTAGTTVLGLFPSIYGWGGEDYMIKPLALSFGYGLIFATVITLVLVPSFYYIAEDIKGLFARILGKFGFEMNGTLYVATWPERGEPPVHGERRSGNEDRGHAGKGGEDDIDRGQESAGGGKRPRGGKKKGKR